MGKWLNKTLKPKDSPQSQNHADIEDLARLVDGRIDSTERKRLLRHLNRCGKCYHILQETLKDGSLETSEKPDPIPWWKMKSFYALAASIILILIIGGQLVFKHQTQQPRIISAVLDLNQELKDILLEDNALQWTSVERIDRLVSALQQNGLQVKNVNRVVLSKPYYQTKSLFGPKETLHIRIEDKVAYLEVKEAE